MTIHQIALDSVVSNLYVMVNKQIYV